MAGEVYFWGCWNDSKGHYLWRPTPTRYESLRHNGLVPWKEVDGTLTPQHVDQRHQVEGETVLHHCDGWTALAWWDRSVDNRGGSNAAIFARGTHDFDAMIALGKLHFPGVMVRFRYELTWKGPVR